MLIGCAACGVWADAEELDMEQKSGTAEQQSTIRHTDDGLTLQASFSVDHEKLVLVYQVRNAAAHDVYLLNRLYRSSPTMVIDPNLIYVRLDSAHGAISLRKKIDDIPTDRNVNAPISPFVTPVRSGGEFSERVVIGLPLREHREYLGSFDPSKGNLRMFHQVMFSLGYYWSVPGTKEVVKEIAGHEVILPQLPPGTKISWGVAETSPVPMQIPAIDPYM
jgi:hypothetical protein